MTDAVLGWDVGGANVKAALLGRGKHPQVVERPFALWRAPGELASVLAETAGVLGTVEHMAVTMTAELADCFATKRDGVASVLDAFAVAFPQVRPRVFGVDGRFRSVEAARAHPLRVAAANWMASALLVADFAPDALFVDVGSTTADVIPIIGGRVAPRGRTDVARLRSGELVYTGLLRTPVCAIVKWLPYRGRRCRVAAERFAIAADAHRWLGQIGEAEYDCETPDGRGRSREEAGARLARMVCADVEQLGPQGVTEIATHVARAQVNAISRGIVQVMRRQGAEGPQLAVLAGQGTLLARPAAEAAGLATCTLEERLGRGASRALPATAVALLLARENGR